MFPRITDVEAASIDAANEAAWCDEEEPERPEAERLHDGLRMLEEQ